MKTIPKLRKTLLHLAIASTVLATSACTRDSSSNPDDPDSPETPTNSLPLTQANFEGDTKDLGPRLHTILNEVFRHLELIVNASLVSDINNYMILSNSGTDSLFVPMETCTNDGGITTFFNDITNDGLSSGDTIVRDFDNISCTYDFGVTDASGNFESNFDTDNPRPRRIPTNIEGRIAYTFSSDATDEDSGIYRGTATFGDGVNSYDMTGELLSGAGSETEAFLGTVGFDIDFSTGDATFSDIDVVLETGTTSLSPARLEVTSVTRTLSDPLRDSIEIVGGAITSTTSGQQILFETVDYDISAGTITGAGDVSAPKDDIPDEGGIAFYGDNSTALMRVTIDVLDSDIRWGATVLDADNSGVFNVNPIEAEATSWSWFFGGFLLPNIHDLPAD